MFKQNAVNTTLHVLEVTANLAFTATHWKRSFQLNQCKDNNHLYVIAKDSLILWILSIINTTRYLWLFIAWWHWCVISKIKWVRDICQNLALLSISQSSTAIGSQKICHLQSLPTNAEVLYFDFFNLHNTKASMKQKSAKNWRIRTSFES